MGLRFSVCDALHFNVYLFIYLLGKAFFFNFWLLRTPVTWFAKPIMLFCLPLVALSPSGHELFTLPRSTHSVVLFSLYFFHSFLSFLLACFLFFFLSLSLFLPFISLSISTTAADDVFFVLVNVIVGRVVAIRILFIIIIVLFTFVVTVLMLACLSLQCYANYLDYFGGWH